MTIASDLDMGSSAGGGYYQLNGGLLTVPAITSGIASTGTTGDSGTGSFTLNCGTLAAAGANPNYIDPSVATTIQAGGAIINTGSYNITIPANLTADPNSTGGGLTKYGRGTLTLTGSDTYIAAALP